MNLDEYRDVWQEQDPDDDFDDMEEANAVLSAIMARSMALRSPTSSMWRGAYRASDSAMFQR